MHADLWQKQAAPGDLYAVSIHPGMQVSLKQFRSAEDAPGQKSCARFGSNLVESKPVNGYPRLMWRTRCLHSDQSEASILQWAVRGKDALYHVQKIWSGPVSDVEVDRWIRRLLEYGVCEAGSARHPCP